MFLAKSELYNYPSAKNIYRQPMFCSQAFFLYNPKQYNGKDDVKERSVETVFNLGLQLLSYEKKKESFTDILQENGTIH